VQSLGRGEGGQTQHGGATPPRPTALDIAKERYARGEISRDEFEQMKRDLEQS